MLDTTVHSVMIYRRAGGNEELRVHYDQKGRCSTKTTEMRPAIKISSAAKNCTCAETATPLYLFSSNAKRGQAAIPENIANHPFVIGQGPWCMRRATPPIPATKNHAHALIRATAIVAVRA